MISIRFWLITVEGLCVEASLKSWEQKNIRSVPYNWWCTKLEKANNRLDSVDDFSVKTMWQVDQGQLISVFKWRRFLKDKISVRNHYVSFFFDVPLQWLYFGVALFGFHLTIFIWSFFEPWNHFLLNFFLLWSLDHKIGSRLIPQKWPFLWTCALRCRAFVDIKDSGVKNRFYTFIATR